MNKNIEDTKNIANVLATLAKDEVYTRIQSGFYNTSDNGIHPLFESEVLECFGLSDHPKKGRIFGYVWEKSHSCGYQEVFNEMEDIADLFV